MSWVELVQDRVKFWFDNIETLGSLTRGMVANFLGSKHFNHLHYHNL
jgi:hypothetical protein